VEANVASENDKLELVEASETSVDSSDSESDEASTAPVAAEETLVDVAPPARESCVGEPNDAAPVE
jgi:hypothetical protein